MVATGEKGLPTGWTVERLITAGGLIVGVVLGLAGNIPPDGAMKDLLFAASSVGLVVASVLLVLRESGRGADVVAGGFGIFALAEMIIWVGGGTSDPASAAPFAAATLFFVPALLMISAPPRFPAWTRMAGALAAVPFGIHAATFLVDREPAEILEMAGYLLLTIAVIGWIVELLRSSGSHNDHGVR